MEPVRIVDFASSATPDRAHHPETTAASSRKVPSVLPRQVVSRRVLRSRKRKAEKL
jgi:hypothetical protein